MLWSYSVCDPFRNYHIVLDDYLTTMLDFFSWKILSYIRLIDADSLSARASKQLLKCDTQAKLSARTKLVLLHFPATANGEMLQRFAIECYGWS